MGKSRMAKREDKKQAKKEALLKSTQAIFGAPEGWRKGTVDRKVGNGKKIFICNPSDKKFWTKSQVKKYFEQNPEPKIEEVAQKVLLRALKRVSEAELSQHDLIISAISGLKKSQRSKKIPHSKIHGGTL